MRHFARISLLWILIAFVGEAVVGPLIAIKGVRPDFAVIALVILALSAGTVPATVGGFLLGLVQDLSNPGLLGLQALTKTGLGFGLGRLRGRLVYGVPVVEAGVIFTSVLVHDFFFLLVQSNLTDESFFWPLLTHTFPMAVYSVIAGVPLMRMAEFMGLLRQED